MKYIIYIFLKLKQSRLRSTNLTHLLTKLKYIIYIFYILNLKQPFTLIIEMDNYMKQDKEKHKCGSKLAHESRFQSLENSDHLSTSQPTPTTLAMLPLYYEYSPKHNPPLSSSVNTQPFSPKK